MKVSKTDQDAYVIRYRGHTYTLTALGWVTYSHTGLGRFKKTKATESSLLDILVTTGKTREQIATTLDRIHEELKQVKALQPKQTESKGVYHSWTFGAMDSNAKYEDGIEFNFSVKFTDKNEAVVTDESRASPITNTPDSCASPGSKTEKS